MAKAPKEKEKFRILETRTSFQRGRPTLSQMVWRDKAEQKCEETLRPATKSFILLFSKSCASIYDRLCTVLGTRESVMNNKYCVCLQGAYDLTVVTSN